MKISPPIKRYRFSAHFSGDFVIDGNPTSRQAFSYPLVTHWDVQKYLYRPPDLYGENGPLAEANIEFLVEGCDEEDAFSAGFQQLENWTYPGILKDAKSIELRITTD